LLELDRRRQVREAGFGLRLWQAQHPDVQQDVGKAAQDGRWRFLQRWLEELCRGHPEEEAQRNEEKYVHHRGLQQPYQALLGEVQAEDQVLFQIAAHDGNFA